MHVLTAGAALWLLALAAASCATADEGGDTTPDPLARPLRFGAQTAAQLLSRADGGYYVESGPIKHGTFCLTYMHQSYNSSNTQKTDVQVAVADVDFDRSELEGIGIGIISTGQDWKELAWRDVYEKNDTFYMDNVRKDFITAKNKDTAWNNVVLDKNTNPFKAGLFDYEHGTNDLLWGVRTVTRGTNPIVMDLHHNMSIIRVSVWVDETNAQGSELDLTDAELSISSLIHEPYSFNRKDGTLDLGSSLTYETLTLVHPAANPELNWAGDDWPTLGTDEETEKEYKVYTTKDFVLPPQSLLEDTERPRLTIKTKSGKTFSGILPHAMWEYPADGGTPSPMLLSLLKEHKLLIRTIISQDPPQLTFMPVVVIDWVDKGTFNVEGHQAGIYNADNFYKLVDSYENYSENQLGNYGYIEQNKLCFNVFASFTLDYDKIHGRMAKKSDAQLDFVFDLNRYTVKVRKMEGETEKWVATVTAAELYTIVTSTDDWAPQEPEERPDQP